MFGEVNQRFSSESRHLRGSQRGYSITQKARNSKAGALISLGKLRVPVVLVILHHKQHKEIRRTSARSLDNAPLSWYNMRMIKIIKQHGLLDADFIQPVIGLLVLITLGEIL